MSTMYVPRIIKKNKEKITFFSRSKTTMTGAQVELDYLRAIFEDSGQNTELWKFDVFLASEDLVAERTQNLYFID
jgi:hypothetical protein